MQRVQRKFGTFLKRSEDEADVGVLLQEYDHVEKLLSSFIAHGELWREAWRNILKTQLSVAESFHVLYQPIGTDENVKHITAVTPEGPLMKVAHLESTYSELRGELGGEITSIDTKLLRPAADARDSLRMLKKVIKRRDDFKLDYERYHTRVEAVRRKDNKSPKEEAALAKHEGDLAAATHEYQAADDQIKRTFPPLIEAVSGLLPFLLSTQIMLQHSLVGNLYTSVYGYCQHQNMASSPPSLEAVVSAWDSAFTPLRHEVESGLEMLASGKAVHQPMEFQDPKQGTVTGLGLRTAFADRRKSSHGSGSLPRPSVPSFLHRSNKSEEVVTGAPRPERPKVSAPSYSHLDEDEEAPPPKPARPGSSSSPSKLRIPSSSRLVSVGSSPGSPHMTPLSNNAARSRTNSSGDYFNRDGKTSAESMVANVAAKKKPPPPPPMKRLASAQGQFVTALFDFVGQNSGDLSFREGDRIRVTKKTNSTNDWWEGEVSGVKGSFPANYVEV